LRFELIVFAIFITLYVGALSADQFNARVFYSIVDMHMNIATLICPYPSQVTCLGKRGSEQRLSLAPLRTAIAQDGQWLAV
jgi:hypothetical protein